MGAGVAPRVDQVGRELTMTLLTACFVWWFAAMSGLPYPLFALLPASVACAALSVFCGFFGWSLLGASWPKAPISIFELRTDPSARSPRKSRIGSPGCRRMCGHP